MSDHLPDWMPDWVSEYLTSEGPVLGILTLVCIWLFYQISRRVLRRYLLKRAYKEENVQNFLFMWRYICLGTGVVFGLVSFSGSLASLGISAAFLGMILGWSLQAPVTGIAAWLMIILKRPFKIGDRVIITGIIGDVVDISLTHVLLNQVGGTIGGEEKSGRAVLIPNATLFSQVIYNYTLEDMSTPRQEEKDRDPDGMSAASFILDEVVVRLTHQSDLDEAERILIEAAKKVTADIVRTSGEEPFIRAELFDSGLHVRLRYQTMAKERQRISSDIVRLVLRAFRQSDRVEFAYPHVDLMHAERPPRPRGDGQG